MLLRPSRLGASLPGMANHRPSEDYSAEYERFEHEKDSNGRLVRLYPYSKESPSQADSEWTLQILLSPGFLYKHTARAAEQIMDYVFIHDQALSIAMRDLLHIVAENPQMLK